MTVTETGTAAARRNYETELDVIRASKGLVIMVRERPSGDQEFAPPQFDALITEVDDHRILPWIHYRTLQGDQGTFVFDVNTVVFLWCSPRLLEITDPGGDTIILYTRA